MWHYFKAACRILFPLIFSYFFDIKIKNRHKEKYPIDVRYYKARKLLKRVPKVLDADFHVEGLENLPKDQNYCLFSNHISMIDPVIYVSILDKPLAIVAKKELTKAPFVPTILGFMDGEFLDRDDLKESLKVMMRVQDDLSEKKHNWLIFPEGKRNKDIKQVLLDFHHGTFRPSYKSNTPIVPCVIYGTKEILSTKYHLKRYPIYVKFLKPLYYEDYKDLDTASIAKLVQSEVQQDLTYNARVWHNKYMTEHYKRK